MPASARLWEPEPEPQPEEEREERIYMPEESLNE